jgi:hypothetical protein
LVDAWGIYESAKRDSLTISAFAFGQQNLLGVDGGTAPTGWNNRLHDPLSPFEKSRIFALPLFHQSKKT